LLEYLPFIEKYYNAFCPSSWIAVLTATVAVVAVAVFAVTALLPSKPRDPYLQL